MENKNSILQKVIKFCEELDLALNDNIQSYVIDLVVLPDGHSHTRDVILVELNPWSVQTGAALFNWDCDKDVLESKYNTLRKKQMYFFFFNNYKY